MLKRINFWFFGVSPIRPGIRANTIPPFQAVIVIRFLAFFSPDKGGLSEAEAYSFGGALVLFLAMYSVSHHVIFVDLELTGMRVRVASCALIYRDGGQYSDPEVALPRGAIQ